MKPEARTVKRRSTLEGENVKMGFAAGATAHLMSVLTDLYKDRILACIREYSTNALDAQIMAGVTASIEVWTPTPLNPVLRIRDHGIGLDSAGIAEIYSQYGASTKRNSDDYNGMLGLGCKAALSYTDQFTVVGVKDGIKTVVAVSRDEDGGGDMRIVSTTDTDERNGVEVQIPTRPADDFAGTAAKFFSYWKPGTVLLNGQKPKHFTDGKVSKITDRIYTVEDRSYGYGHNAERDRIVMGGVAYPCKLDIDLPYGHSFVCFVNIGEVTFVPSREALRDTKNTKDTLVALAQEYSDHIVAAINNDVASATTPGGALRKINDWRGSIPRQIEQRLGALSYKGRAIPITITGPFTTSEAHGTLGASRDTANLSTALIPQTVFVHNYDLANFTPTHKKKLLLALENHPTLNANEVRTFALSEGRKGDDWVEDSWRLDWTDVKALKLPKTTAQLGAATYRISGSYDVSIDNSVTRGLPAADFDLSDPDRPVVFANIGKWSLSTYGQQLTNAGITKFHLVQLTSNRVAKFQRDFPNAVEYSVFLKREYAKWVKTIPADKREALAMRAANAHSIDSLKAMDPKRVDDPAVKRAIRLAKVNVDEVIKRDRLFRMGSERPDAHDWSDGEADVLAPYLLIDGSTFHRYNRLSRSEYIAQVYDYMNDAYARRTAGGKVANAA